MFKKLFTKKGSAEIVSIVLGIVVVGGLALAVTGTLSKQTNASMNQGMKTQTEQMVNNYNEASTPQDAQNVNLTVHGN